MGRGLAKSPAQGLKIMHWIEHTTEPVSDEEPSSSCLPLRLANT